MKTSKACAAQ